MLVPSLRALWPRSRRAAAHGPRAPALERAAAHTPSGADAQAGDAAHAPGATGYGSRRSAPAAPVDDICDAPRADEPPQGELASVEELLIEFLGRHSIDDTDAFEALCGEHPARAAHLRELHQQWAQLDRVLGQRDAEQAAHAPSSSMPPQAGESRSDRVGEAADRDACCPSATPQAMPEVLARLESQRDRRQRYLIESELARGGMGVVYVAWDRDLRRRVAMKVLRDERLRVGPSDRDARERIRARFVEEAQITGQLDHPGVVPVHEIGLDDDGRLFFTMPLVRGRELGRLFALAREGREGWQLERLLAVFVRICEAVAYAHSKGVVHRDLKPSNVMVGSFGETYVMDWGLARLIEALPGGERVDSDARGSSDGSGASALATRAGAVIGTPAYMAPEQAAGQMERVGAHSDVYAIGAMLYHLLAGSMPYADSTARLTPQALIAARLSRAPTPLSALAPATRPELIAICAKAMAEAPEQRYPSALALAADLEAYLGRRAVRAFDSGPLYLARLALRRNAKLCAAVGGGLALALALLASDARRARVAAGELARRADALAVANGQLHAQADETQARALLASEDRLELREAADLASLREWIASAAAIEERSVLRRTAAAQAAFAGALGASAAPTAAPAELLAALSSARARVVERVRRVESRADEDRAAWELARASIAASERYGGLVLEPQWGLSPLQLSPVSGLWEFWVVESGERPRIADLATGRLEPDPRSALVLVLIPGGAARLGSSANDFGRNLLFPARQDGRDRTDNEDERWLELEPFFLGKCEVTQAVWLRVMGANPAHFADDEMCKYEPWSGLLPVESVTWRDAREFTGKLGLALPTEAQWEYAARCGRLAPLAFGASDDLAALEGVENLNDQLGRAQAPAHVALLSQPWCDGYWSVAPVMSLEANAWGLHDLLGNVSEACEDVYSEQPFGADLAGPGGVAPLSGGRQRVFRGASYFTPRAEAVRVAFRQWDRPTGTNHGRGVRVARPIR